MNKPCDHEWVLRVDDGDATCVKCGVQLDTEEYERYCKLKKRMQAVVDGAMKKGK